MQITIGPGEATSIVLAIIGGCVWIVLAQSRLREAMVRIEARMAEIPILRESVQKTRDRMHEIELQQASRDPHRAGRMRPLSRASEEPGGDEA